MVDEQAASGGVPNAFGNAIAHRWAPELPRPLRAGFLKLLYALRAVARPDGTVAGEHSPYRISQITQFCGADEKDTRRYLRAAIAAGVVTIPEGEKVTRGKANTYVLLVAVRPDWQAAVKSLETSRPKPSPKRSASVPPWQESSGDRPPNRGSGDRPPNSSGDQPPNSVPSGSGDRPPSEFGGPTPDEFGGPTPGFSGSTQEDPQEVADVVPQPQVVRAREVDPFTLHEFKDRGDGSCRHCNLPANNTRRHFRRAA